uniref:tRNA (uracil(54)-C(5))-methyltransferase n=1 Tax=Lynx canadensis TaxID=61383 RepID=A0A667IRK7_LYNCA
MHSLRCFFSKFGLISKRGLLPWCAIKPPGWSQLFWGRACKGNFMHIIGKKCQRGQKRHKKPMLESFYLRLADVVTPLWTMKFEAQKKILQRLESYLQMLNGVNVTTSIPRPEGFICPVVPLLPCLLQPVINGPDGNPKTVGHYLGIWRDRNIICVWSNHLKNIPEKHNQVAHYYEVFLRQSPIEPCFLFHEGGYWCERTFCVQKEAVKKFFTTRPGAVCDLTSPYFQESTMMCFSHQQSPYQLLFGDPHLFEDLLGLKIHISPDAFSQINTAGAEVLYLIVGELSGVNSNTILLDICCGTGVIGLSLAQYTSQVLGMELVEQAVEHARWTAAFSGITNCEFHTGQAENILPQLLKSKEDGQFIVAVVNSAQVGLHYYVVQGIQNCRAICIPIFVSCKPHGETTRNIIEMCCPPDSAKKPLGEPFVLRKAVPVDLFPHTLHCELVLLFT